MLGIERRSRQSKSGSLYSYEYLTFDLRVGIKKNSSVQKCLVYDEGNRGIAERDASANLLSHFVYANKAHVPDYMIKSGVKYKFVHDHVGSVVQVVNSSTGALASSITYDEFGKITSSTSLGFQPFGFAGGIRDDVTGFVRFGARDYDPETGRWTSKDPILFGGGDTNLYGYVMNDPINLIDSSGLSARDVSRIRDQFNNIVNTNTGSGFRHTNGFWGNIMRNTYNNTGGRAGHPYYNCVEQSEDMRDQLSRQPYDDNWSFDQFTTGQWPFTHDRVRATSSNPNDPVLILDPWRSTID